MMSFFANEHGRILYGLSLRRSEQKMGRIMSRET
jgi:hypothetical protein